MISEGSCHVTLKTGVMTENKKSCYFKIYAVMVSIRHFFQILFDFFNYFKLLTVIIHLKYLCITGILPQ